MTTKEEDYISIARTKLEIILLKADKLGLVSDFSGSDYPEYIHDLWHSILHQPQLQNEALEVEKQFGLGDTIQLLSDVRSDLFDKQLKRN